MPPTEWRAGVGEIAAGGDEVFLRVEGAVFADGVTEQEVERRAGFVAECAVQMRRRAGAILVVFSNGAVEFVQQSFGSLGL